MNRKQLILGRYEVVGLAGAGGFGTVQIAWDRRIQRKVAIKTIQLTDRDARRAALPGADAVSATAANSEDARTVLLDNLTEEGSAAADGGATADGGDKTAFSSGVFEVRKPPKAQTPAQARARREAEEAEREAHQEELARQWEQPWVEVPQKVVNTLSLDSLPVINLSATADESETDDTPTKSRKLVLPHVFDTQADGATAAGDGGNDSDETHIADTAVIACESTASLETEDAEAVDELADTGVIDIGAGKSDSRVNSGDSVDLSELDEELELDEPTDPIDFEDSTDSDAPLEPVQETDEEQDDGIAETETPIEIIDEARQSLKDLSASHAHATWDGKHPWDDFATEADRATNRRSEILSDDEDEEEHVTALAHLPGLDEARTAAKLSDPRIVAVYDFEVRDNVAYLIMEYIEGITLSTLLDDYADYLTIDMVTSVFDAVAGALEVAHDAGVLHLDIKPDNIIITKEGQAKVTDFGLATLADASGGGFTGGGTIGYMPLEQMRHENLDARADEWSLAALIYEMLTGSNPFRANTLAEAERAILDAELPLPSRCWPALDAQLDDVIFYALDPNREERYATIADFADEVDKFLGDGEAGGEQLALVVEDALSEEPESSENPERPENPERSGSKPTATAERDIPARDTLKGGFWGFVDRLATRPAVSPQATFPKRDNLAAKLEQFNVSEGKDEELENLDSASSEVYVPRAPLFQRVPEKFVALGARIAGGAGSALVGTYALSNMAFLTAITGDAAIASTLIEAVVFAAIGLVFPLYSALVTFCLLGISICLAGHPIVGAALIVITGLWWYVVGREGLAENNVAFLGPLTGSIGAGAVAPLFAGAALKPLQAALTMAYSLVVACVFASFGSESLLGWDIFAHASFADANITLAFGRMLTRPLTWSMAAGWLAGAVLFSFLNLGGRRWTFVVGLVLCVACVLTGSLVFTPPTPQLFISLIAGSAVLLVVFV